MSMAINEQISALGATPYVEAYSAIELVGNIQLTALIVFVILMAHIIYSVVMDRKDPPKFYTNAWGTLVFLSLATLITSTFVRIWL